MNALMLGNSLVSTNSATLNNMGNLRYYGGDATGLRSFKQRLDRGEDVCAAFVGDSTFYDTINAGLPRNLATWVSNNYGHRVEFRISKSDASGIDPTIVKTATTRRHWYWGTGDTFGCFMPTADALQAPTGTDLRVECECSFEAAALTAGFPSTSAYILGWGTSSNGYMRLAFLSGVLALYWSEDTSGTVRVASVTPPTIVADTIYRWRADLDVDNGSSGRTIRFYYSTNSGSTWTQISTDVVQAGVTVVAAPATYSFHLNTKGDATKTGLRIYDAQIFGGTIAAPIPLIPWRIDQWEVPEGVGTDVMPTLSGDPVCYIDVAAQNGATLQDNGFYTGSGVGDFPTEAYRCFLNHEPSFLMVIGSHNDAPMSAKSWGDAMDSAVTKILARFPLDPPVVHSTENPEPLDYGFGVYSTRHNQRQSEIMAYSASRGRPCFDPYSAFLAANNPAYSQSNNVHPTSAGYTFWLNTFISTLRSA